MLICEADSDLEACASFNPELPPLAARASGKVPWPPPLAARALDWTPVTASLSGGYQTSGWTPVFFFGGGGQSGK